jgi:hypothetical protein
VTYEVAQSFFEALSTDDEFLRELGRLILGASKFESVLREYADQNTAAPARDRATLRELLRRIRESSYLAPTLDESITNAIIRRNYFVHSLFERLRDYTIEDFSVEQFKLRLRGLTDDLEFFSRLIANHDKCSGASG